LAKVERGADAADASAGAEGAGAGTDVVEGAGPEDGDAGADAGGPGAAVEGLSTGLSAAASAEAGALAKVDADPGAEGAGAVRSGDQLASSSARPVIDRVSSSARRGGGGTACPSFLANAASRWSK
jgi:hypothetical protein